ncbi:MAG TPA: hypothetical protein VMV94_01000 [Phycisphaerae bacterium]|nr:hypothetical protein [Phycisphaerae bacterium]
MSSRENTGAKICVACGKDAANLPRVKDSRGRYLHKQCYEAIKRKLEARKGAPASQPAAPGARAAASSQKVSSPAAPRPAVAGRASGGRPAAASHPSPAPPDLTSEVLEELPVLDPAAPLPVAVAAAACPACGHAMPNGAVICVGCGFNSKTGKIMATSAAVAPKAKPVKRSKSAASGILDQPWLFGAGPALVLLVLFAIGRGGDMAVLFMGFYSLYSLAVWIWVLIKAFSESALQGILCLCVYIYLIYFVFAKVDDSRVKYAFAAHLLGFVLYFLLTMAMASEGSGVLGVPKGF